MLKKIKGYLEYRRNKRMAKKALVGIAGTILPIVETVTIKGSDIIKFIIRLVNEAKSTDDGKLIEMILNNVADVLKTDDNRLIEILAYMASLQPDEIQKILVHSIVETNPKLKETK